MPTIPFGVAMNSPAAEAGVAASVGTPSVRATAATTAAARERKIERTLVIFPPWSIPRRLPLKSLQPREVEPSLLDSNL
jgi:hypothetical protein